MDRVSSFTLSTCVGRTEMSPGLQTGNCTALSKPLQLSSIKNPANAISSSVLSNASFSVETKNLN